MADEVKVRVSAEGLDSLKQLGDAVASLTSAITQMNNLRQNSTAASKAATEAQKAEKEASKQLKEEYSNLMVRLKEMDYLYRQEKITLDQLKGSIASVKSAGDALNLNYKQRTDLTAAAYQVEQRAINGFTSMSKSLGDVNNHLQKTNPAFISLNQIIQDSPYGLRGMGNNIQFLTQQFTQLRAGGMSTGDILRNLMSNALSPMGLLMAAVSIGTSALTVAMDSMGSKANETSPKMKTLKEEMAEIARLQYELNITTAGSYWNFLDDKLQSLSKIKPESGSSLGLIMTNFANLTGIPKAIEGYSKLTEIIRQQFSNVVATGKFSEEALLAGIKAELQAQKERDDLTRKTESEQKKNREEAERKRKSEYDLFWANQREMEKNDEERAKKKNQQATQDNEVSAKAFQDRIKSEEEINKLSEDRRKLAYDTGSVTTEYYLAQLEYSKSLVNDDKELLDIEKEIARVKKKAAEDSAKAQDDADKANNPARKRRELAETIRNWREQNEAASIALDSIKAGLSSVVSTQLMVTRQAKDGWDAAWIAMENAAISAIEAVIQKWLEMMLITGFFDLIAPGSGTAISTAISGGSASGVTSVVGNSLGKRPNRVSSIMNERYSPVTSSSSKDMRLVGELRARGKDLVAVVSATKQARNTRSMSISGKK